MLTVRLIVAAASVLVFALTAVAYVAR